MKTKIQVSTSAVIALLVASFTLSVWASHAEAQERDPWLTLSAGQASHKAGYCSAWMGANDRCFDSSPTTTLPLIPERPVCPKGENASWNRSDWSWEKCEKPAPIHCDAKYPELLWVDGAWGCYEGCGDGMISHVKNGIKAMCYSTPECGAGLDIVYVEAIEYFNCQETSETSEQFWTYATHRLKTQGVFKKGKWIGGLASVYNKNIWEPDGLALSDRKLREIWTYSNSDTDTNWLEQVANGTETIDICYNHDCETEGTLIGSTDADRTECQVFVWNSDGGVWFVMHIAKHSELCEKAYEQTKAGIITGASTGSYFHDTDTGKTKNKNGIPSPIHYEDRREIYEISLVVSLDDNGDNFAPVDNHTWVSFRDFE